MTWVQPVGGTVEDQVPTIHVRDDVYYVLSLRSMKIVFRHIRLSKDFVNREQTVVGEWKLRIPMCLLREKIRTQMRFNVLSCPCVVLFCFCTWCGAVFCVLVLTAVFFGVGVQALRKTHMVAGTAACASKSGGSAIQKIVSFVNDTVLVFSPPPPGSDDCVLSFTPTERDTLNNMFDLVESECPRLVRSKCYFFERAQQMYDYRFEDAG